MNYKKLILLMTSIFCHTFINTVHGDTGMESAIEKGREISKKNDELNNQLLQPKEINKPLENSSSKEAQNNNSNDDAAGFKIDLGKNTNTSSNNTLNEAANKAKNFVSGAKKVGEVAAETTKTAVGNALKTANPWPMLKLLFQPVKVAKNIAVKIGEKIGTQRATKLMEIGIRETLVKSIQSLLTYYESLDLHEIAIEIGAHMAPEYNNDDNIRLPKQFNTEDNYYHKGSGSPYDNQSINQSINKNLAADFETIFNVIKDNIHIICPDIVKLLRVLNKYEIADKRLNIGIINKIFGQDAYDKKQEKTEYNIVKTLESTGKSLTSFVAKNEAYIAKKLLIDPLEKKTLNENEQTALEEIFKKLHENITQKLQNDTTFDITSLQKTYTLFRNSSENTVYNNRDKDSIIKKVLACRILLIKQIIYCALYKIILGVMLSKNGIDNGNLESVLNSNDSGTISKTLYAIIGKFVGLNNIFSSMRKSTLMNKFALSINVNKLLEVTKNVNMISTTDKEEVKKSIHEVQSSAELSTILDKIISKMRSSLTGGLAFYGYNLDNVWKPGVNKNYLKSNSAGIFVEKLFNNYRKGGQFKSESSLLSRIMNPVLSLYYAMSVPLMNIASPFKKAGLFSAKAEGFGTSIEQLLSSEDEQPKK